MKVAACQLPDVRNDVLRALSLIESYVDQASRQGAQLVCFPECFLQGYTVDVEYVRDAALDFSSPEFSRILRRLAHFKPTIVLGVMERKGDAFFNSAAIVERGELAASYRKVHLLDGERPVFMPGDVHPVFNVAGIKVTVQICYDLNFPNPIHGAELLVCPCNNMMGREKAEKWKHRHNEIRAIRAHEASAWLLSSDVTGEREGRICYGPTAAINPKGVIVDQVPLMTEGLIVTEIP